MRIGIATIAIAVVIGASARQALGAPATQVKCHVWAYYMGFWPGSSGDAPLRGNYTPGDPSVAAEQIREAKSAGIEAFIVDWRGPGDSQTTSALNNMLDQALRQDFMVGAAIDSFNAISNGDRGAIEQSLRHLLGSTIHHPAYLRYRGEPVIFFAFQQHANVSKDEWIAIRSELDPNWSTTWVAEGTRTCPLCGVAMDGMFAFNMAWSDGKAWFYKRDRDVVLSSGGWLYIPTVNPGWDESSIPGRPNPTSPRSRENGAFLRALWEGAASAGGDVRLVVSWNEYAENHHIEPSVRYGTQSLDVLRELTSRGCSATGPERRSEIGTRQRAEVEPGELVRAGEAAQLIQFNPGAALQRRILADGFVPNSGEFDISADDRTWRCQRAEHLGDGRVRVYYAATDDFTRVFHVQRHSSAGPLAQILLQEGERAQLIQFNPGAALQKRIFADRYVPNSAEFRLVVNGVEYAAQRAEHLRTGDVRVYHAPAVDYNQVSYVTRK